MSIDGFSRGERKSLRWIARLLGNRSGAAATIFALLTPVALAGFALAVDAGYYRLTMVRMQAAVDGAALAGVLEVESGRDPVARVAAHVQASLPTSFGDITLPADITVGEYDELTGFTPGAGANVNAVRVTGVRSSARANAAEQFFSSFFGAGAVTVAVSATAARPVNVYYQPPERQDLAPEAGDIKLLVATAPLTGIAGLAERLGSIAVAGGVLALVMLLLKAVVAAAAPAARLPLVLRREASLPYAVAIAAGMAVWAARNDMLPITAQF